jgi:hypothetical protein
LVGVPVKTPDLELQGELPLLALKVHSEDAAPGQ